MLQKKILKIWNIGVAKYAKYRGTLYGYFFADILCRCHIIWWRSGWCGAFRWCWNRRWTVAWVFQTLIFNTCMHEWLTNFWLGRNWSKAMWLLTSTFEWRCSEDWTSKCLLSWKCSELKLFLYTNGFKTQRMISLFLSQTSFVCMNLIYNHR